MPDGTHQPTKNRRFSWSKKVGAGMRPQYMLFRRSLLNRVHMRTETFPADASRSSIARTLKRMRRELLDEVDAVDLRFLGVTEEAA
jgi:hypothetical protein